jgi:hypothetical protein
LSGVVLRAPTALLVGEGGGGAGLPAFSAPGLPAFSAHCRQGGCPADATLAQLDPGTFAGYSLLFLMLFIATNKVFSPQYLLWLAPLVCLIPFRGRRRSLFVWTFLLVCVLTTILFPFLFLADLVGPGAAETVPLTINDPTPRLATLLVIRNLLFLAATGLLAAGLWAHNREVAAPR